MSKNLNTYIAHRRASDEQEQLLENHLWGVAKKARLLAEKIGLGTSGELLGLLHDLGKYSTEFQIYIKSATGILNQDEDEEWVDAHKLKGKVDHSSAGAQYLWNNMVNQDCISRLVAQILSLCIASHHSGLIDCLNPESENIFERRMQKADEKTHLTEIMENANQNILEHAQTLITNPELVDSIKKSICVLLKSTSDHQDNVDSADNIIIQFKVGLLVRFLFSCLIDADRIDSADFENPKAAEERPHGVYKNWEILIARLENHLNQFETKTNIDHIRRDISQHCVNRAKDPKGLFTLTVPTGGGKTLASLRFALHHAQHHQVDRILYVIPFTSIIDQNAEVVRKILEIADEELGSIVLEHHSNLTPQLQTWQQKVLSENWDAPIIYTTTVQLLDTLFGKGTRDVRRMHQLANSIIIFDEIQALPISCMHMFCNAMNYLVDHCGSSIVLCTATQPLLNKLKDKQKGYLNIPQDRELMPDKSQLFSDLKRVEILNKIRPEEWSDAEIATLAVEEMNLSSSCLVIVNTKSAARAIFQQCIAQTQQAVYHLSTAMCPAHRLQVLDEIKHKLQHEPIICISTQLIEAGVDIDFGTVIRFAAGMDSIAQAAGRCNRNARTAMGRVYIVNPQSENLKRLTEIKIGKETTERILREFSKDPALLGHDLLNPKIMDRYFEYYFHQRSDQMEYRVGPKQVGRDDSLLSLLSTNENAPKSSKLSFPDTLRHSFMSAAKKFQALDAPNQGVIVPYTDEGKLLINQLCSSDNLAALFNLLKKTQRYTVNLYSEQMRQLLDQNAIYEVQKDSGIYHLDEQYYDEKFGLSMHAVNPLSSYIF